MKEGCYVLYRRRDDAELFDDDRNIFKNDDTSDANIGAGDKANSMTVNVVYKRESALSQYA